MQPTSSVYDDPRLQAARNAYTNAAKTASEAEAGGITLADRMKAALNEKFSQDNPQVQNRESRLQDYLKATTEAPASVLPENNGGVVFNPIQQANLINTRRAVPLAGLTTANYLLGLTQGGIPEIINATANAYNANTTRLKGEADTAHQNYSDILGELTAKAQEAMAAQEFAEKIREFNVEQANKKSTGSGGVGGADLTSLMKLVLGGNNPASYTPNMPTESKPTRNPTVDLFGRQKTNTNTLYRSPQGQWIFDYHSNDWVPVVD